MGKIPSGTKVRTIVISAVILLALGLVIWQFALRKTGPPTQADLDLAVLENKQSSDQEIFAALNRLSAGRAPEAREYALQHLDDAPSIIEQASANALGNYDDEQANAGILYALEHSDAAVRMRAIQSLGYRPESPARLKLLKEVLDRPALRTDERIAILNLLARMTPETDDKKKYTASLLEIAKAGNDQDNALAGMFVMEHPFHQDEIKALLHDKISKTAHPQFAELAVNYLSERKDPWLKQHLPELLQHKYDRVKAAAKRASENLK